MLFFSKTEKRRHRRKLRIKLYLLTGLLGLAVLAVFYFLFNAPFLQIKKFDVSGPVDLQEIRGELLKGNLARALGFGNFLSWPSEVNGFRVEKDLLTGTLKIIADLSGRFAIWCDEECYWVNASGQVLESAPDTEGSSIPKIIGDSEGALKIGSWVMPADKFENIQKIIFGLDQLSIGVREYKFSKKLQELTAFGIRGERMIFGVRFAPSTKIFTYLQDLSSSGKLRTSEYVDFTVENRIYLK